MELAREQRLELYRTMATIRRCDDRFHALLQSGAIAISYYSPRGQEAVAAGVGAALRPTDQLVTTYRGLHDQVAKGVPLKDLWSEYLGRATGPCKGKGGPMHLTHPASGLMLTTGIVGAGLPVANGLALALQLKGQSEVVACSFGDGATNIGAFHEALNLASVWTLPVVFVCQNNGYAEHTRFSRGTSAEHVIDRAPGYRVPGVAVDGLDPEAVYFAASEAVDRARSGGGPTLIEATVVRLRGHAFGDDASYVPAAVREQMERSDPLPAYRSRLVADGVADEAAIQRIDDEVAEAVGEAEAFALESPWPDEASVLDDIYASESSPRVEVGA